MQIGVYKISGKAAGGLDPDVEMIMQVVSRLDHATYCKIDEYLREISRDKRFSRRARFLHEKIDQLLVYAVKEGYLFIAMRRARARL